QRGDERGLDRRDDGAAARAGRNGDRAGGGLAEPGRDGDGGDDHAGGGPGLHDELSDPGRRGRVGGEGRRGQREGGDGAADDGLRAASIGATPVRLLGPGGAAIAQAAGSPSLDGTGTVATITPAAALAYTTSYQIQVVGGASGVKDAAGNAMAATYQQTTGFRT